MISVPRTPARASSCTPPSHSRTNPQSRGGTASVPGDVGARLLSLPRNGRRLFSFHKCSGSISHCVVLLTLPVLKAPVSWGMAIGGCPHILEWTPTFGRFREAGISGAEKLFADPSEGQCQEQVAGVGAVGPHEQRKQAVLRAGGGSCSHLEHVLCGRGLLAQSREGDVLKEIYFKIPHMDISSLFIKSDLLSDARSRIVVSYGW